MSTVYWIGASGSQSWADTGNWSGGAVPGTGDIVYILNNESDIDDGLNQSAVTLAKLIIVDNAGTIGTATAFLQISASEFEYSGEGTRAKFNFGANKVVARVVSTTSTLDGNDPPLQIIGTHTDNELHVSDGTVGVGTHDPTDASVLAVLNTAGGTVTTGYGVTVTAAVNNGCTLRINKPGGAVTTFSGSTTTEGAGTWTTITTYGGTTYPNHRNVGGTSITTLNERGGSIDYRGNPAAITIGTAASTAGDDTKSTYFSDSQVTYTAVSRVLTGKTEYAAG